MRLRRLGPVREVGDWALVGGLGFFIFIFKILPFGVSLWLAKALSKIAYHLVRRERKKVLAHLDIAFPYMTWQEKRRIAKRCFANLARSLVEEIRQDDIFKEPEKFIKFEGLDELGRAQSLGKGVVVFSAHLGNWEMLAAATSRSGLPVTVVAREIKPEGINRLLLSYRERSKVRSVLRDRQDAARELLRSLKNGHVIGILVDQDTRKVSGEFFPFFEHLAYTPIGAATLVRISGAAVFLGLSWHEGQRLVFHFEQIDLEAFQQYSNREFDCELTQHLTERVEKFIKEYPDQWAWVHERWKHRPDGSRWKPYLELPGLSSVLLIKVLAKVERIFGKRSLEKAELAGAKLGRLILRLASSRKKVALENVTKAFDGIDAKEAEQLVKRVFENFGMNIALYLRTGARTDDVFENLEVEGFERLEQLLKEGRGVLAVSAHMGAWDMGAWWVAQRLPLSVVVKKMKNGALEREAERIRGQFGLKTIYDRHTSWQIFRRLERGEVVVMVLDQHAPSRISTWVDFFGRPASTLKSAASISAKARVPVILGYTLRLGAGRYKIILGDTFEPPELDDESIKAATQQYTLAIENAIRAHPEQWFWLHKRWKTKPPDIN